MDRSPLFLAALASAAVPGLDPASVEAVPGAPDHQYDLAFVQDTQHRRWVVRVPRSAAAAAEMEATFGLLALLSRRLPFAVPTPRGFVALKEGGRAAVYPYLPGRSIDFAALPAGPGLAAELGRSIAALHNADHALFEEAGLPAYDADTYRTRRLSELDRAASTGHVPTGLLSRWEKALEDVRLWRFAPTPTHGDLTGDQVLAVFADDHDAASGTVKAITAWEDAKVADPADDFFALVTQAPPQAFETVMEAYAHARSERPDAHLVRRAKLSAEMRSLGELMSAVAVGDRRAVERHASALRRLDDRVHAEDEAESDYTRPAIAPARRRGPVLVPPEVTEEDEDLGDDDVEVMFAPTAQDTTEIEVGSGGAAALERGPEPAAEPQREPDSQQEPEREPDSQQEPEREPDSQQEPEREPDSQQEPEREPEPAAEPQPEPIGGEDPGPEFEPGFSSGEKHH